MDNKKTTEEKIRSLVGLAKELGLSPEKIEEIPFPLREKYPFSITLHSSGISRHDFSSSSDRHQV